MSHPFGGHPTLQSFVEWVTDNGCTVEVKVRARKRDGLPYRVLEVTSETSRVAIVDPNMNERLAPSEIAYLQRRLGIKTPFAATPEPSNTESIPEA